jgi:CheY-like chemotaxis protein
MGGRVMAAEGVEHVRRIKMKILLVDDSQVVREQVMLMLKGVKGVTDITQAETPDEAWAALQKMPVDVLILDMILKNGNGLVVLQKIRESGKKPPLIIMMTNYSYDQVRAQCLDAGADYFLDKSVDFERIPALLGELEESR